MGRIFVGRERELEMLNDLRHLRVASLVVLKGRRRIGKSRLAEEFGKQFRPLTFLGLAPEDGISAQEQREHFAEQLSEQLDIGRLPAENWDNLLWRLAKATESSPQLIILDEINWMGSKDRTFLPKLKTAWDKYFSKNLELICILSGSMSGWIERNILSSTGFFGRVNLDLTLEELPLHRCAQFWGPYEEQVSAYEKFKILSVTGGVPRYLELIQFNQTAEENIARLCFRREGILFHEFDRIFSDLFMRKNSIYRTLVEQLVHGHATADQIMKKMGHSPGGTLGQYLDDLVETRYLSRDYTWDIKSGRRSRLSSYRLSDNYLRFYLRYIAPHQETIETSGSIAPPEWHTIMGLQFENLVLNNRRTLYQSLNIDPATIIHANPFFQTKTNKRKGCQIDLLIQTTFNTLYLCEIKFSKHPISPSIIEEMEEKIRRLTTPRGYSIRPVLIHVNGVHEMIEGAEFFYRLVDFSTLLHTNGI